MLTSVYYYNFYRPYIISNRDPVTATPKRGRIAEKTQTVPDNGGSMFILNKSRRNEIIQYASNVSGGLTRLKSSVRQIAADMENYNRNSHQEGNEAAAQWIADDLSEFADAYNKASGFMQNQQHSADLRMFSYEMNDNVYYNRERLSMLGMAFDEQGHLSVDAEHLSQMNPDQMNIAIGENIQLFNDLYQQTTNLMHTPLSDHLHIRTLSYHYNYKLGTVVDDGFNMIESGMLIDFVV